LYYFDRARGSNEAKRRDTFDACRVVPAWRFVDGKADEHWDPATLP